METLPPAFQKVVDSLRGNRAGLVTAYGLYYWDVLALFPLEYRHIWKSRTTPVKVFYLLNRYVTLALGWANAYLTMNYIELNTCRKMVFVQPLFSTVIIGMCGCISTIRVHAIWNRDKRILALLCTWLASCVAIMLYCAANQQALILPEFLTAPAGFTQCLSTRTDNKTYYELLLWTSPLTFDTLVLVLTTFRYVNLRHRTGGVEIPILRKIAIKHIFYFALIATTNAVNVGFFAQSDPTLKPSNAVLTITLTSMMSSRLVLSLLSPPPPPFVKSSKAASGPSRATSS